MNWKDEEQIYIVWSLYVKLQNPNIGEQSEMYNISWSIKVIPSTQHFASKVMFNKVVTKENLRRRGSPLGEIVCAFFGLEDAHM